MAIAALFLNRLVPSRRDAIIRWWSRGLLDVLNVELRLSGTPPAPDAARVLLIGNHVSWLDIHAINSARAVRFIAKSEIRGWPLFGWLAAKVNTFFLDRGLRQEAGRMVTTAAAALAAGDCLCYFPEGTTTDGRELKPFKGSLLQSAIDAGALVWPFAIRYVDAWGNIDVNLAYYGDISLLESMRMVLACRKPIVELSFLTPISPERGDRRILTLLARSAIEKQLQPSR